MKRILLLFALAPGLALPQTLGGKAEPITSGTQAAASGFGPLLNVLLALGIVYGLLRFAMPKLVSRMNRRLAAQVGSDIRIEESATFAGGSLYVVSARGKSLLLSVSTQGVQCLADLTAETPAPEPLTFGDFVEHELRTREPIPAAAEADRFPYEARVKPRQEAPQAEDRADGISEALRRLERLAN